MGKVDAVRELLDRGVDMELSDRNGNYVTKQHLRKAQDDIVSDPDDELVPFENAVDGSESEIFGVQGLNSDIRGYENPSHDNFILVD